MATPFKLLSLYDPMRNAYVICAHNLSPDDAEKQVTEWSDQHLVLALIIDQREQHETPDPQQCLACRRTVETSLDIEPTPQFKRSLIQ